MPELRPVTINNWLDLIKLDVSEDQKHFVAPNVKSIAEMQFGYDEPGYGHWDFHAFGIYDEDVPVGFLMYGLNYAHPEQQAFIVRLMVDQKSQKKGFGHFGMQQMLEIFRCDEHVREVGIGYEPDNDIARKLYAGLGFVETGEMVEGETLAVLKIR